MKAFGGGVAVLALVLTACGDDDGGAAAEDPFCDGAEQFEAVYEQVSENFSGVLTRFEEVRGDPAAQDELVEDLLATMSELRELGDDIDEAFEQMMAGADEDLRRGLEVHAELSRATFDLMAGVESAEEWEAASAEADRLTEEMLDEHPDALSMLRAIDDATQERCDVLFLRNPFELLVGVDPSGDGGTLPEVDVCALLPPDVLATVEMEEAEGGSMADLPANQARCSWGEPFQSEFYVELALFDPPFKDLFLEQFEPYGEIASREAYVDAGASRCDMAVDHGEFFLTVEVDAPSGAETEPCEITAALADAALSALG